MIGVEKTDVGANPAPPKGKNNVIKDVEFEEWTGIQP